MSTQFPSNHIFTPIGSSIYVHLIPASRIILSANLMLSRHLSGVMSRTDLNPTHSLIPEQIIDLAQSTQANHGQYRVPPQVLIPFEAALNMQSLSACSRYEYLSGLSHLSSVFLTPGGSIFAEYIICPPSVTSNAPTLVNASSEFSLAYLTASLSKSV